jgi:hypothetical protein
MKRGLLGYIISLSITLIPRWKFVSREGVSVDSTDLQPCGFSSIPPACDQHAKPLAYTYAIEDFG